jgi:hypothetical protein
MYIYLYIRPEYKVSDLTVEQQNKFIPYSAYNIFLLFVLNPK